LIIRCCDIAVDRYASWKKQDHADFILLLINLPNCCTKVAIGCRLTPKSRPHHAARNPRHSLTFLSLLLLGGNFG